MKIASNRFYPTIELTLNIEAMRYCYTSRILLVFFLILINVYASNGNDQDAPILSQKQEVLEAMLFNALLQAVDSLVYSKPDSALYIADIHFRKAESEQNKKEMILALDSRGLAYCMLNKLDNAAVQMKRAIVLCEEIGDIENLKKTYANLGTVYYYKSDYVEAFRYLNMSLAYFKKNKNSQRQADIVNNLGLIYLSVQNYEKALIKFEEALALYEKDPNYKSDGNIWINIGSVKHQFGKYHEAITYFKKAKPLYESSDNMMGLVDYYYSYALSCHKLGLEKEANELVNKSVDLAEKSEFTDQLIDAKRLLAEISFDQNPSKAERLIKELYELDSELKTFSQQAAIHNLYYKIYKAKGNSNLALKMYERFKMFNDSVQIEEDESVIAKTAIEQEYQEQIQKNKLKFLAEQNKSKLRQTRIIFSTILISLILIGLLYYYGQRRIQNQKAKQAELLEEIEQLKRDHKNHAPLHTEGFHLNREKIEKYIGKSINETDWNVMNILLDEPVISNKNLAEKAFKSVDGIGSSLRRMYQAFKIKESRYMKISLLMELIKISR